MSSAVRPMALAPDERFVYFQVSFFHGFVEYDLKRTGCARVAVLPLSEEAKGLTREDYLLDSAHHGIAMNPRGTKLCVAGTMSDYAAIVTRRTFAYKVDPGRRQALLVDPQRRRPLLLRLGQRRRPCGRDLLREAQGGREHPGRRPSAAHAHRRRAPQFAALTGGA